MYRRLYITIQWPHVLTEYCILYINYLMYRLLYRYTAIQRDTSDLMYRHPSGKRAPPPACDTSWCMRYSAARMLMRVRAGIYIYVGAARMGGDATRTTLQPPANRDPGRARSYR